MGKKGTFFRQKGYIFFKHPVYKKVKNRYEDFNVFLRFFGKTTRTYPTI